MSIACMERYSSINTRMMVKCIFFVSGVIRSLIYVSFGGLLMSLEGDMKYIQNIKYGDRLYCLIRRVH